MSASAKFKIRNVTANGPWSPFADGGFDASAGDVLELQLEDSPALDVRSCTYSFVVGSKGAAAPAFASGGVATPPTAAVQVTLPAGVHSYKLRATTNGGETVTGVDGKPDYSHNLKERIVAVRSAQAALRKGLATETTEYSASGGWMDAQNEMVDAIEAVGGGGTPDPTPDTLAKRDADALCGFVGVRLGSSANAADYPSSGAVRVANAGGVTQIVRILVGGGTNDWGVLRYTGGWLYVGDSGAGAPTGGTGVGVFISSGRTFYVTQDGATTLLMIRGASYADGPRLDFGALTSWAESTPTAAGHVGMNPTTGRLRCFADGASREVEVATDATVQTTDDTVTTLATYAVPDNAIVRVEVEIVARRPSNGDSAVYRRAVGVKRHGGGGATLVGAVQDAHTAEDVAGWDATLDVSGNDLRVRVTGEAAATIEWRSRMRLVVLTAA